MFWADEFAIKLGKDPQHVDDMTSPSGYSHIGSLRGPILHDVVAKVLKMHNDKTVNTYVFNDFDVIDGLPADLKRSHGKYMGFSGRMAPAPYGEKGTFAEYFAHDFQKVLTSLGVEAEYISSWDMYHEGKFNKVIREALDNAEKIQDIYLEVSGSAKKSSGWLPFQVICPKCKKLGTTHVNGWDGKKVTFTCEENLVTWATGCGYEGAISPFNGAGKLPWKVDWPAHWKVLGVTFEGAGKDHTSAGGSYDVAFELCDKVFKIPRPFYFSYEHFLLGGKKMSSSKGIGFRARDVTTILPPDVARFLFVRVKPKVMLEFSPDKMTIPDLFDEFDRCAGIFWKDKSQDLGRVFELSQVSNLYENRVFLPRFRDVVNIIQLHTIKPIEHFEKEKGSKFTDIEKKILGERIRYAKYWIENLAPEFVRFTVTKEVSKEAESLSVDQKAYLSDIADSLNDQTPEELQTLLYNVGKEHNLSGKQAFQALYIALLGKNHGPKAAWFIHALDREFVKERFVEVADI